MKKFTPAMLMLIIVMFSACDKDKDANPASGNKNNFIPEQGHKFEYKVTLEDGELAKATKWVTDAPDSLGINVFDLHTDLQFEDRTISLFNKIFDINGKTVTDLVMPDMWNDVIDMIRSQDGITVVEATPLGFPAYMLMENPILADRQLTFQGPATQGQYLKFRLKRGDDVIIEEITQSVSHNPGKVVAVETITTPAGTFTCSKWQYSMDNEIEVKLDGDVLLSQEMHEDITMWTAHGVGVVKSVNTTETGVSTTELQKIH